MRYIIVVDEKPKSCDECPFFSETLEETDKKNVLNITNKCIWTKEGYDKCPLTVVNTLFVDGKSDE